MAMYRRGTKRLREPAPARAALCGTCVSSPTRPSAPSSIGRDDQGAAARLAVGRTGPARWPEGRPARARGRRGPAQPGDDRARSTEDATLADGRHRVELDGHRRARAVDMIGTDVLVAEVEPLDEGDAGDEWGVGRRGPGALPPRHAELRSFLDSSGAPPSPCPGSTSRASTSRSPPPRGSGCWSRTPPRAACASAAAWTPCSARSRGAERGRPAPRRTPRPGRPQHRTARRSARARTPCSSSSASLRRVCWARSLRDVTPRHSLRRAVPGPARLRHVLRLDPRHQPRPIAGAHPLGTLLGFQDALSLVTIALCLGIGSGLYTGGDLGRGRDAVLRPRLQVVQDDAALGTEEPRAVRRRGGLAARRASRAPVFRGLGPSGPARRGRLRSRLRGRAPRRHGGLWPPRPGSCVSAPSSTAASGASCSEGPALRLRGLVVTLIFQVDAVLL